MWLYIPGTTTSSDTSASVAVEADSISPSTWQSETLARFAWWRGNPFPSRDWSRRWKAASWLRRLYGRMPEPSTADAGADRWMASLEESPARPTASLAGNAANSIPEISGRRPDGSSPRLGRGSSSSKTSPVCSPRGMTKSLEPTGFGETYEKWVSRLRQDYSARKRSNGLISGNGFLSSAWPTPLVADAAMMNDGEEPESFIARRKFHASKPTPTRAGFPLAIAAKMWPTTTVQDSVEAGSRNRPPEKARLAVTLTDAVLGPADPDRWITPQVMDSDRARAPRPKNDHPRDPTTPGSMRQDLKDQASTWPTPRVSMHKSIGDPSRALDPGNSRIEDTAALWPSPQARDHHGVRQAEPIEGNARPLNEVAALWRTPTASEGTSGQDGMGRPGSSTTPMLATQTTLWRTPNAVDAERGASETWTPPAQAGEHSLNQQTAVWSTPRASDAEKGSPAQSFGAGGIPLPAQAVMWSTPTVGDTTGGHSSRSGDRMSEPLLPAQASLATESILSVRPSASATETMDHASSDTAGSLETPTSAPRDTTMIAENGSTWRTPTSLSGGESRTPGNNRNQNINLEMADALASSLPVPETETDGPLSPRQDPIFSQRSLNQAFVEWLMAHPPAWTSFECSVMQFTRWKADMEFALSLLPHPEEPAPAQLDLFA